MSKRLLIAAVLLVCSGCGPEFGPVEPVIVVLVKTWSDHKGHFNERLPGTIVEFPDGTRRWRAGVWGEVGDQFCAQKFLRDRWR